MRIGDVDETSPSITWPSVVISAKLVSSDGLAPTSLPCSRDGVDWGRGVELFLEGGNASLLWLGSETARTGLVNVSVGLDVTAGSEDASLSASCMWLASIAFSNTNAV